MSNETTDQSVRPHSLADTGPMGLAGFALTTFVLSIFNAGIVDKSLEPVVLPLALFYGGLVQLIAGVLAAKRGNTFGATAFCSYGAFWMAFALYAGVVAKSLPADTAHTATGIFLLAWAIFTCYMTVVTFKISIAEMAVFVPLSITFIFLAIGNLAASDTIVHIGGFIGLLTAVTAWYASFAGVINSTWKRTVLPVGPRS